MSAQKQIFNLIPFNMANFAQQENSSVMKMDNLKGYSIVAAITNTTPGAGATFVRVGSTNSFTITAHGYATGLVGQASTSSALPTGLATSTNYFVIVIDANTIQLASSLVNAIAGTAIAISSNGTGTQTFTPTALASATVKLQYSNDQVTWIDLANSSNNITVTGNIGWQNVDPMAPYLRIQFNLTSGSLTAVCTAIGMGNTNF